jgi:signal transduction histidine kinase
MEAGVADLHLEPVRVADLVGKVTAASGLDDLAPASTAEADAAVAMIDKRRFERLLSNLLDNATQYGGGPVRVGIDADQAVVRVHIDDAGPGIPQSERQRIFERFARGSNAQYVPGTGLGLALVTEHARMMHGTVSVDRSPEGGARFTVALPRLKAS